MQCETAPEFELLDHNAIMDTFRQLYREENWGGTKVKVITESEMNFGKFDETNLFHIEDSKIYKDLGSGIKTVEFILKYDENSIVFLEAKKSCPNAVNRYESEEKEQKFRRILLVYNREVYCILADLSGYNFG